MVAAPPADVSCLPRAQFPQRMPNHTGAATDGQARHDGGYRQVGPGGAGAKHAQRYVTRRMFRGSAWRLLPFSWSVLYGFSLGLGGMLL